MTLIGFNQTRQHFHLVRKLTEQEIDNYNKFQPIVAEAHNRFKLFRILRDNFNEWITYIGSLLTSSPRNEENDWQQLDRLLLNYLTCAYTIQEHFMVSYRQRFRKDEPKLKDYEDFLNRVCQTSWAFAFFLDFRGYIQHRELGIGYFHRHVNLTSVEVSITHESAQLVADSREWKRSKLTDKRGKLDLVELLNEFNHHMLHSYGAYVAKAFFPDLFPAAQFYDSLTKEVLLLGPGFRMFFTDDEPKINSEEGKQEVSLHLKLVPNNLFAELGISVSAKT